MSGTCGEAGSEASVMWALALNNQDANNPTYTLTISGKGAMADYSIGKDENRPWKDYVASISAVTVDQGVTEVGDLAFHGFSNLKTVSLAEGVRSIGLSSFGVCGIESIQLPSTVESLGVSAFQENKQLASVSLPTGLKSIGDYAFGGCSKLSNIALPDGLTALGATAFQNCTSLTTIAIPVGISVINNSTFNGCESLESVEFKGEIREIGYGAFNRCRKLSIVIPATVKTIGGLAFGSNDAMKSVVIPDGAVLGQSVFYGCKSLNNVAFAGAVDFASGGTSNNGTFADCDSLTSLRIPSGATHLSKCFVSGSDNLKVMCLPATVTSMHPQALSGSSLTLVYIGGNSAQVLTGALGVLNPRPSVAVLNGGEIPESDVLAENELATPVRAGYVFGGWFANEDFSGDPVTAPVSAKNHYAKWLAEIKFDGNGASGSMNNQQVEEGDEATKLMTNAFTKTGYTFTGWNTQADGTGTAYAADAAASSVPAGTTLYAQWEANSYTIEFVGGEGAEGSTLSVDASYDAPVVLTANGFSKKDMKFEGWDTDSSADEIVYSDASQVKNLSADDGATVTLYAVWGAKPALAPDLAAQTQVYSGSEQGFELPDEFKVTYQRDGQEVAPKDAGSYDVVISADETDDYAEYHAIVYGGLVIDKASLNVKADDKSMYVGDSLPEFTCSVDGLKGTDDLESIGLSANASCASDGKTAGTFDITVQAEGDPANYAVSTASGKLTVSDRPVAPSDKTETTTDEDGNKVTTVTKADGSKTVTTTAKDGTESVVEYGKSGNVISIEVKVSEEAAKAGETVLPLKDIAAESDSKQADSIKVSMPASVTAESPVQVTVPVAKAGDGAPVGPGTVVVVVNPDGTETVLPKTAVADGGVVVELEGSAVVKVVDNAKALPDVAPDDWFAAEVAPFATARGIVNGVPQADGGLAFEGDAPADRATFVRMLHNLELNPEAAGEGSLPDVAPTDWYADAAAWALEAGVLNGVEAPDGSKSFDGGAEVTREQMALFLMRYAQHLGLDTSARAELAFPDAADTSAWAEEAMSWAVAEGLFMGDGSTGELNPGDGATRAQVAAVMMRFINGMYA